MKRAAAVGIALLTGLARGEAPLRVREGLFRLDESGKVVAPLLRSESTVIFQSSDDGPHYSHHPHFEVFDDTLYAMWSSGSEDEDGPDQHVLYSTSDDGMAWTAPKVFAADPDGARGALRLTAGGWWTDGEKLMGCYTEFNGRPTTGTAKWLGELAVFARVSVDGSAWSPPQRVMDDLLVNEGPRRAPQGGWLMTGENRKGKPRLVHTGDDQGMALWADVDLMLPPVAKPPNEATWFARHGGGITLVFRDDNRSQRLYATAMSDYLRQTTVPLMTDFLDARAKPRADNLPGGEVVLIGNPSPNGARNPLTLAVSRDGVMFEAIFSIKAEPTAGRYTGKFKGPGYQYPDCLVWRGHLYVIYSINKEDIGVTRIALDWLASELESPR